MEVNMKLELELNTVASEELEEAVIAELTLEDKPIQETCPQKNSE